VILSMNRSFSFVTMVHYNRRLRRPLGGPFHTINFDDERSILSRTRAVDGVEKTPDFRSLTADFGAIG
jgi:hypothetical protein